jgi:hypothetical protein
MLYHLVKRAIVVLLSYDVVKVSSAPTNNALEENLVHRDTAKYVFAHFMVRAKSPLSQ